MKETGIIMSGNHPKLILSELKTMTRRTWGLGKVNEEPDRWIKALPIGRGLLLNSAPFSLWRFEDKNGAFLIVKCPYGGVGDRLWCKETCYKDNLEVWRYKADDALLPLTMNYTKRDICPSLFMPRKFSRITSEITGVRAERLIEITEEDALAEGITITQGTHQAFARNPTTGKLELVGEPEPYTARYHYEALWDSLNAERGYGFDKNPWVWGISFKRIEG